VLRLNSDLCGTSISLSLQSLQPPDEAPHVSFSRVLSNDHSSMAVLLAASQRFRRGPQVTVICLLVLPTARRIEGSCLTVCFSYRAAEASGAQSEGAEAKLQHRKR